MSGLTFVEELAEGRKGACINCTLKLHCLPDTMEGMEGTKRTAAKADHMVEPSDYLCNQEKDL